MFLFKPGVQRHVEQLQGEILRWVDEVWAGWYEASAALGRNAGWKALREVEHPFHGRMVESLRRLRERFGEEKLGVMAADMLFNPALWFKPYTERMRDGTVLHERLLYLILSACLAEYPPPDVIRRLEARLNLMLRNPLESDEAVLMGYNRRLVSAGGNHFLSPNARECLTLLMGLPETAETNAFVLRLLRGDLNYGPIALASQMQSTAYQLFNLESELQGLALIAIRRGILDYDQYRAAAFNHPRILRKVPEFILHLVQPDETTLDTRAGWNQRLLDEVAGALTPENAGVITNADDRPCGPDKVILAAKYIEQYGIKKLTLDLYHLSNDVERAVVLLGQARDAEPPDVEERQQMIAQLKAVPARALKVLLPVATPARRVICEALGWESGWPLVDQIERIASRAYETGEGYTNSDVPNSPDPDSGVVDVAALAAAIDQAGESLMGEIVRLFSRARRCPNTLLLVQAAAGANRDKVLKSLNKHSQIAIKAYGLLPLERGEEEVLERYLKLQQIARDGQKYGAQRRQTHAAAVQAALANLAQLAGYGDADRLELAMEARIAEEIAPPGRTWEIGPYTLELALEDTSVELRVERGGRTLKSIPKDVRGTPEYEEAKEAASRLRQQASRLRRGYIENLLASGEPVSPADLARILRLPVARPMLDRLIWQDENGRFGLLDSKTLTLVDLDDRAEPVRGPVRLAHPYHLFHAGVLPAWQRKIVQRRIVQPVKQAFRELYLLTPAEQETRTYSNRFAGHVIDARVANRLFAQRGWRLEHHDAPTPYKLFPGLRAVFALPDARYFLGGDEPVTTDRIYFEPYPLPAFDGTPPEHYRVPLEEVPPLIFSEVMRDADLVVSVAQRSSAGLMSNEVYARRAELVAALLDDLGLKGVTTEGHFAYVQGRLAQYRVHLGSAAIHIMPGNYLCIVPDRRKEDRERLFLPFADENDSKTSEVISKILLLANDHKIKDESILRQIRRG